mmetsp:Transcript_25057/g.73361  ORF Transcript_25057/g.73361 Transcript_25057/m.73361 type:complete len:223 (-) Transcript_25057:1762-2430(-)
MLTFYEPTSRLRRPLRLQRSKPKRSCDWQPKRSTSSSRRLRSRGRPLRRETPRSYPSERTSERSNRSSAHNKQQPCSIRRKPRGSAPRSAPSAYELTSRRRRPLRLQRSKPKRSCDWQPKRSTSSSQKLRSRGRPLRRETPRSYPSEKTSERSNRSSAHNKQQPCSIERTPRGSAPRSAPSALNGMVPSRRPGERPSEFRSCVTKSELCHQSGKNTSKQSAC